MDQLLTIWARYRTSTFGQLATFYLRYVSFSRGCTTTWNEVLVHSYFAGVELRVFLGGHVRIGFAKIVRVLCANFSK